MSKVGRKEQQQQKQQAPKQKRRGEDESAPVSVAVGSEESETKKPRVRRREKDTLLSSGSVLPRVLMKRRLAEKEGSEKKEKYEYYKVKSFRYASYVYPKTVWYDNLKSDLTTKCDALKRKMISEGVDADVLTGKAATKKANLSGWISTEEFLRLLAADAETALGHPLLDCPHFLESASRMLEESMDKVSQATLEDYNRSCRSKGRTVVNTVDCASQVECKHGLKRGRPVLEKIRDEMADLAEKKAAAREASEAAGKEDARKRRGRKRKGESSQKASEEGGDDVEIEGE
jgi:hypothetical protein